MANLFLRPRVRLFLFSLVASVIPGARAQIPFYTDDTEVTPTKVVHMEFFNEFDALQSAQFPSLRQNTSNFKANTGLPHNLELDFDIPYISIYRANGTNGSSGIGDANMGIKWKFHQASPGSWVPSLASTFYVEFPTGSPRDQLGSGLTDYWLNFIAQVPLTDKTRVTTNVGFLFAGNTSTGVVGIQTRRGHVYTGGLSLLHDFSPRLTLGGEAYGGIADTTGLGRSQLQGLVGGMYAVKNGVSITLAVLGGKYEASPTIGGQVGLAIDLPSIFRRPSTDQTSLKFNLPSVPNPHIGELHDLQAGDTQKCSIICLTR